MRIVFDVFLFGKPAALNVFLRGVKASPAS